MDPSGLLLIPEPACTMDTISIAFLQLCDCSQAINGCKRNIEIYHSSDAILAKLIGLMGAKTMEEFAHFCLSGAVGRGPNVH